MDLYKIIQHIKSYLKNLEDHLISKSFFIPDILKK